jgi:hypothetical protein
LKKRHIALRRCTWRINSGGVGVRNSGDKNRRARDPGGIHRPDLLEEQFGRYGHNRTAGLEAVARVFELREFFEWRGLGSIDHSGVRIREAYSHYDAERKFDVPALRIADPKSCQCGEVLKGVIKPWQCKVFGSACKPETPLGALMVSSEGACAAYYQYGDLADRTRVTTNPG